MPANEKRVSGLEDKKILIRNIRRLYSCDENGFVRVIENPVILIEGSLIIFVGDASELKYRGYGAEDADVIIDAMGMIATPGFIDAHTHLVFAGRRSDEFERRCAGETYCEIAKSGGGILKTVKAVRDLTADELYHVAEKRLDCFIRSGCTTVEIKSGYGLDMENELKMLEVIKRLGKNSGIEVVPTFLAHIILPEYMDKRGQYIELITKEMLPEISAKRLAEFCDVFHDDMAFSYEEAVRILIEARRVGFKLKLHTNQFRNICGGFLAAELGCVSAEHLNHTLDEEIHLLAEKGVSVVLFPGCFVSKGGSGAPPVRKMLDSKVNIAISTDYNPGSSTTRNLTLMGTLAMSLWGMTYKEVFRAITRGAALALSRENVTGRIDAGFRADISFFDCESLEDLFYDYGTNFCRMVIAGGRLFKFFDQDQLR